MGDPGVAAQRMIGLGARQQILAVGEQTSAASAPHGSQVDGRQRKEVQDKGDDEALAPGLHALVRQGAEQVRTEGKSLGEAAFETEGCVERVGVGEEQPLARCALSEKMAGVALAVPARREITDGVDDSELRILAL